MPRSDRLGSAPVRWARTVAIAGGGLLLLAVTAGATWAEVMSREDPLSTARLWPLAASVKARLAEAALDADPSRAQAPAIKAMAAQALLREPVNVIGARVAALAAALAGDDRQARRLLAYAQNLSRRDLRTQTLLIEMSVTKGDVTGALRHYDIALRVGGAADQLLLPVLVEASRNPEIAAALQHILVRRPPWRGRFVYTLLSTRPWGSTFPALMLSAKLDMEDPLEREFLGGAVKGLVDAGAFADAARLYTRYSGRAVSGAIRNGRFTGEDRLPPFDWDITDGPDLGGVKGSVDGAPFAGALTLHADPGRSGVAARQLISLDPGRHVLRFVVGGIDTGGGDRSSVSVTCAGPETPPLANIRFPVMGGRSRTLQTSFDVPANCAMQWVVIYAASDIDASADTLSSPWVSDVSVAR